MKSSLINKKVIVRSDKAGVFYGILKEIDGDIASLSNCRRIWYWDGAASISQLAKEGVKFPENCTFTVSVNKINDHGKLNQTGST